MVTKSLSLQPARIVFIFFLVLGFVIPLPVLGEQDGSVNLDRVSPEYATGFTVDYYDNYKVVTVLSPWRGSNETFTYLLVNPGTTPPELNKGEQIIELPIERFVSLSSTYLPYLPILGITGSLKGATDVDSISTPEVVSMVREGKVIDVSGGGSGMASGINLETLIELDPDLVMAYATGQPEYDSHNKLQEAGIPVVLNAEYMESDPLGRAEWVKFISVFFNKEKEANAYFEKIKQEYTSLEKTAASLNKTKPSVFLNNNWQGTWYMAGGNSYVAELLEDAGADYLWSDDTSTGSIPLDFEVVYEKAQNADFWIDPGTVTSLHELLSEDSRYSDFAAVKSKKVYNNNARMNSGGGNDYWETGVAHPEIVLKDLLTILHPDIMPNHDLVYFTHLE